MTEYLEVPRVQWDDIKAAYAELVKVVNELNAPMKLHTAILHLGEAIGQE